MQLPIMLPGNSRNSAIHAQVRAATDDLAWTRRESGDPVANCGHFGGIVLSEDLGWGADRWHRKPRLRGDASWLVVCLKRCARNTPRNTSRLCNQATRQTSELST